MYQFIVFLRAIACILITNSHQEEVYPIRILASGGLLGDVLFFAISGYCLYSLKYQSFGTWYFKRLKRVYLPVWLTAGTLILTKVYGHIGWKRVLELMLYPTHYHFVASILVLYIVYFFLMRFINQKSGREDKRLIGTAAALVVLYFVLYYTVFDRSYYHIDNVNGKMIWCLFMLSMLIGAYFRRKEAVYINKGGILPWVATVVCGGLYAMTKLIFSRGLLPVSLQWLNQVTIILLLICIFRCFIGVEQWLKNLPSSVKTPVFHIADMAFELYLAQAVIIPTFNTGIPTFPRNFIIVISITFLFAWLVHVTTEIILELTGKMFKKGTSKQ
ncbi:MAG: acyltransferase [Clostridia bacterium]|nr:acyltransferase [Clostridia bacterium]